MMNSAVHLKLFSSRRLSIASSIVRKLTSAVNERISQQNVKVPNIKPTSEDNLQNFNLATHVLAPWANEQPNRPVLWMTDGETSTTMTYLELYKLSKNLASYLINANSSPPKCGLVILPKIAPWWVINLAGSWCEMAISPGTSMLAQKDLLYRLETSKADAIFCDSVVMSKVYESTRHMKWKILVEESRDMEQENRRDGWLSYHEIVGGASLGPPLKDYDGDSVAQLFFTSGTTGNPKLIPHTQRNYCLGHVATSRDWLNLKPEDVLWNISDLGWAKAAFSSLYAPLIAGCTIFVHKMPRFDAKVVLRTLEELPVSVLCLPPTALRSVIQEDLSSFKPKSLKTVASAGEPLNPEILQIWHKYTGIWIREGYGQTETALVCASVNGVKVKPGSMGKPVSPYDVKILDENLLELGPNEPGEIAISLEKERPSGLFKGYTNQEQNLKSFRNKYFLTGDKAYIDEEGYVCFVGRLDDIIISAGYRTGPYEVESALIEHPAVAESGVVASPDYQRGHVVKAFIVLKEEYKTRIKTAEGRQELILEIQNFIKSTIAPYKYPRKIEFVESLPKTISGKIRRVDLREKESRS